MASQKPRGSRAPKRKAPKSSGRKRTALRTGVDDAAKIRASGRRQATAAVQFSSTTSQPKTTVTANTPTSGLPVPVPDSETRATLVAEATPRFGKWRAGLIADLVCRTSAGGGWFVHKAALDGLVRRQSYGKRDKTSVLRKPRSGIYGTYSTGLPATSKGTKRSSKTSTTHYTTELRSLDPLVTSCNCADFVRSSLGLCKHGMAVLDSLDPNKALRSSVRGPTLDLGPLASETARTSNRRLPRRSTGAPTIPQRRRRRRT